jgi:hypothetical protein
VDQTAELATTTIAAAVEGRDGHTGDVMDFFGREHLTTVGQGFRHEDSLRLEGDDAEASALR